MTDEPKGTDFAALEVRFPVPGGMAAVRRDAVFTGSDGEPLTADIYVPADGERGVPMPAVLHVEGYPDPGFERIVGRRFKDMGSTVSWSRLFAASGLAAIAATNRRPVEDFGALLDWIARDGPSIGVDPDRVGLFATSGHGPLALSSIVGHRAWKPACLVLCYPYLLDLDGDDAVASASATFRFANPAAGSTIDDLATGVPLLVVRAGRDDQPGLNASLDRFRAAAASRNLPVTVLDHPDGPHAFDLSDDGERTHAVIRQVLAFLQEHLAPRRSG